MFFFYDLCCDYISAAPLEEDVEVLSAYLIQLVVTQNLEQLWKVLKFLDRYATNFCCCFNCKIGHVVLIRSEIRAYRHTGIQGIQACGHTGHTGIRAHRAYGAWSIVMGYTAMVRDKMRERGM